MPFIDGKEATSLIREAESNKFQSSDSNPKTQLTRVPIFAVSASIEEKNKKEYIDAGFDGWVLKPIDFAILNTILAGIHDSEARAGAAKVSEWGTGGWFAL